jgi:GNAT superfamily N-acetyltransferase
LNQEAYNSIKKQLKSYRYHSLDYTEYEEISEYNVLCNDGDVILIAGFDEEAGMHRFHWAANGVTNLLNELNKTKGDALITFIPEEWIDEFKKSDFDIYAIWNDYFNNDISEFAESAMAIELLEEEDCREASEVTLSCKGQSRGFTGQSEEWMKLWKTGMEPNAVMSGAKDSAVLVHRENDKIIGVVCVTIYGHSRETGAVLWVRELAVRPEFHRKGIAKMLLKQALFYGKNHGAKRGFLMADECNVHAAKLYESLGFDANKNEAEIDMIRN